MVAIGSRPSGVGGELDPRTTNGRVLYGNDYTDRITVDGKAGAGKLLTPYTLSGLHRTEDRQWTHRQEVEFSTALHRN